MASAKRLEIDQNGSWKEIQIGSDFVARSLLEGKPPPQVWTQFRFFILSQRCSNFIPVRIQPTRLQKLQISAWKGNPLPLAQRWGLWARYCMGFLWELSVTGVPEYLSISRLQREWEDRRRLVLGTCTQRYRFQTEQASGEVGWWISLSSRWSEVCVCLRAWL